RIDRGDVLGLIGPNGSGKTTLLRVLLGLLRPTCGHVRLFGTEIAAFRQRERIGYVPQKAAFNSRFPAAVSEVVISGRSGRAGVGHRFTAADREAARRALDLVGLTSLHDKRIGELSSGQQQRVLIARALVTRPELLLLDEPTVGVDPDAQEQFYTLLLRLNREEGVTLILVSHDIGFVTREVSRLACLNRTLVFHGSPEEAAVSGALAQMYRSEAWMVAHRH
ncbi:MAG: metal ABC transporter ATP-binding protein, partial [Gemmatimonadales bacterium]